MNLVFFLNYKIQYKEFNKSNKYFFLSHKLKKKFNDKMKKFENIFSF